MKAELFFAHSYIALCNGLYNEGRLLAAPLDTTEVAAMLGEDVMAGQPGNSGWRPLYTEFGAQCIVCGVCTSTFDVFWALWKDKTPQPWSTVLAHSQREGRGQMRRSWHSPPGNIYACFALPPFIATLGGLASLVTGWLVRRGLATMGIQTLLKWPNDLLLRDSAGRYGKVGGLLLEERANCLVAGLGLNIYHAPDDAAMRSNRAVPATALQNCILPVGSFWQKLSVCMQEAYEREIATKGVSELTGMILDALAWKGETVQSDEHAVSGIIAGVGTDGALLLAAADGERFVVESGSVYPV